MKRLGLRPKLGTEGEERFRLVKALKTGNDPALIARCAARVILSSPRLLEELDRETVEAVEVAARTR